MNHIEVAIMLKNKIPVSAHEMGGASDNCINGARDTRMPNHLITMNFTSVWYEHYTHVAYRNWCETSQDNSHIQYITQCIQYSVSWCEVLRGHMIIILKL